MATHRISARPRQDGFVVSVERSGPFGFGRSAIPATAWSDAHGAGAALMSLLLREGRAHPESDGALLPHAEAARLPEHDTRSLGLPGRCPHLLRLAARGQVSLPGFAVQADWLDDRGTLAFGLRRTGAFLSDGTHRFLVGEPLFGLLQAVERLNAAGAAASGDGEARAALDARMTAFAAFKRALEAATGDAQADRYLDELVVHRATGLGVDAARAADGGDAFLPVLLGDAPPAAAAVASPVEAAENEDTPPRRQPLLPRGHAERLATGLFPGQGARSHYRLGAGVYAVLDPPVAAAMRVLERVNRADRATRAEFRRDPRAFLLEAVEGAGGDGGAIGGGTLLDGPEAGDGFGERVLGVRLWTGKQLSFRIPVSRKWFPEEVGGEVYTIEPPGGPPLIVRRGEVAGLQAAVARAVAAGRAALPFDGRDVPLTPEFVQVVTGLAGTVRPPGPDRPKPVPEPDAGATDPVPGEPVLVLGVAENDEAVTFRARLRDGVGDGWRCDPDEMATPPMPHQRDGIAWLESAYRTGLPGVLLADDMGLGKTYQVLAFLRAVRRRAVPEGARRPVLVVAPKTLLGEWREQIALHLGGEGLGRSVFAYEAGLKDLARTARPDPDAPGKRTLDTDRLRDADWVLTTYETLRDYGISFGRVRFEVAVYDEAQKLKGLTSLVNNAAKSQQADFTVLMTGTPIENSALDLWALLDVAWPGFLEASGRQFAARYVRSFDPEDVARLRRKLVEPQGLDGTLFPPVLLRRFKDDVLEGLPPKRTKVWEREMPPEQAAAYDAVLEGMRSGRVPALEALGRLRAVCLHPRLAMPASPAEHGAFVARSARFSALFEMLAEVKGRGEKALVFVDIIEAQRVLAALLRHRFGMPRMPDVINGATDGAARTRIKGEFQARPGFDVLLLGPRAAGFGLTLTAANHVFHLNRWWNPAVEDQCSDRVHRIGQRRPVTIHLPKAVHPVHREASFDWQLDQLLAGKRAVGREIVVPTAMGEEDFQRLFRRVSGGTAGSDPDVLRSLDLMDWASFEAWVAEEVRATGRTAHATPRGGDGGADVVALPSPGAALRPVLCQCKHRTRGADADVGEEAVHDLLRARSRWSAVAPDPVLAAVTNGVFTLAARTSARENAVLLFDRHRLLELRGTL